MRSCDYKLLLIDQRFHWNFAFNGICSLFIGWRLDAQLACTGATFLAAVGNGKDHHQGNQDSTHNDAGLDSGGLALEPGCKPWTKKHKFFTRTSE